MLLDIINSFCLVTGHDKVEQRNLVTDYINRGAIDLYNSLESDALMREVVLVVPSDMQLSLPAFIGELRGMREYNWSNTFPLYEIGVPRYSSDTWKFRWRNWRYKGKNCLAQSITNAGLLTITVLAVETTPVVVVITGRTEDAQKVVEEVTMDAITKDTTNSFAAIDSITCTTTPRTYDITVSDMDGNTLAILYNNESKTQYIIVDVSSYSWIAQLGNGITTLVETLYKTKFYKMFFDTDEFPADGYDDAIVYKALALFYLTQESGAENSLLYQAKAKNVVDNNISNAEVGQQRRLVHEKNPTYYVFRKLRNYCDWNRTNYYR